MSDFLAQVAIGESLVPIGQLRFTQAGPRQYSTFTYDAAWTQSARAFAIQPDLSLESGLSGLSNKAAESRTAERSNLAAEGGTADRFN
jgi:serine/threonine-protein kinase HipA